MRVLSLAAVLPVLLVAGCQKDRPVPIANGLACQNAVTARGHQGWSFEQVDLTPAPPGEVSVRGWVVRGSERKPFSCAFDAGNQLTQVNIG